ncbi:MAG: DUF465 domain-containing protein [Terriglobia bacterium]
MESGTLDIKEHLLQSNEEFRRLAQQHSLFDEELSRLSHKNFLSDEEKVKETTLKKKKLHVKDQMEMMIVQYRQQRGKGQVQ